MSTQSKVRRLTGIHPSLLDIAFVLVFMFLLLSTLASTTQQEAEERSLPPLKLAEMEDQQEDVSGQTDSKSATVSVQPGPVFFLDDEAVSLEELRETLAQRRPPELEIRGDVRVPYGTITEVLKICRENGISSVALTYKSNSN